MIALLERFMMWHLGPLFRLYQRHVTPRPFSYYDADLRLKELRTMLFFLITGYIALLVGAVFS